MVSSRWRTKIGAFYPVKTWRDHIESGGSDGSDYVHVGTLDVTFDDGLYIFYLIIFSLYFTIIYLLVNIVFIRTDIY